MRFFLVYIRFVGGLFLLLFYKSIEIGLLIILMFIILYSIFFEIVFWEKVKFFIFLYFLEGFVVIFFGGGVFFVFLVRMRVVFWKRGICSMYWRAIRLICVVFILFRMGCLVVMVFINGRVKERGVILEEKVNVENN